LVDSSGVDKGVSCASAEVIHTFYCPRLLSTHRMSNGTKFWIITERVHSATTFLLPEEY
jgi:hypothetical protein